jgi:hypothetical protein
MTCWTGARTSSGDLHTKRIPKEIYNEAGKLCGGQIALALTPYAMKVLRDSFCRISNSDAQIHRLIFLPSTFIELLFLFDIAQLKCA